MATQKTAYVLHLTRHWLRWVALSQEHQRLVVAAHGEIVGAPAESLEQWARERTTPTGAIYLYDGRPMYFTFALSLPRKARARAESAARLKIRQDLGLSDEAIYWAVGEGEGADGAGQLSFSGVVVRREALADLVDWRARHALGALWVGADTCAVRALLDAGGLASPAMIMNLCDRAATLYLAENGEPLNKVQLELADGPANAWWARADLGSWARAHFGRTDLAPLHQACPALAGLPAAPEPDFAVAARGRRLAALAPAFLRFDPVILGGLVQIETGRMMESLLREDQSSPILSLLRQNGEWTRWRPKLAVLAAALLLSFWGAHALNESARTQVIERAKKLAPAIRKLTQQEAVLQRVRKERIMATIPVIESIHRDAPGGLALQSINIAPSGLLKLQGSVPSIDVAVQYYRSFSNDPRFDAESVHLQEVKQSNQTTFQLTAHIKGWTKK